MCDVRLVGCKVSAEIQVSLSSKIVGVSRLLSRFFSKEMHYDAGGAAVAHILRFAIGPGNSLVLDGASVPLPNDLGVRRLADMWP